MNIAVCVKRIPKTAEADIFIEKDGKDHYCKVTVGEKAALNGVAQKYGNLS